VLAVLAGLHAINALPVGVFYDDALYVILGKSMAAGSGYRYLNIPGHPAATHFPPGYPALLAVLWRVMPQFPENVALFKTVNAMLLAPIAWFAYRFARERLTVTEGSAALGAIAGTAAIPMLVLSSSVMSEPLFLALLLPVLLIAERETERATIRGAVLLGLASGLLCLVRSHAVVLIPAMAMVYALRRHNRAAVAVTASGVAMLMPWLIWVMLHDAALPVMLRGSYGSYSAWFAEGLRDGGLGLLAATVRQNVVTSAVITARSFSIAGGVVLSAVAVAGVLVLVVAGARTLAARARVTLAFALMYASLALVWPFSPLRFVWGIWPLLVLVMLGGANRIFEFRPARQATTIARWVGLALATIVFVGALVFNVRGYANDWWATVGRSTTPRILPQLTWVDAHTRPEDVIVAEDEGAVFLYTGRLAVPAGEFKAIQYVRERRATDNARELSTIIRDFGALYVIAWAKPNIEAAAFLAGTRPPLLVQVDTIGGARVLRRSP
jgi:hypothetical protein